MTKLFDPHPLSLFFDGEKYDTEFLSDLMNTCLKNANNKYIPNIKKAIETKDKKLLKDNIHPLKSSLGQIGLKQCCLDGDYIDKQGMNLEWSLLFEKLDDFFITYNQSLEALQSFNEKYNITGIDY